MLMFMTHRVASFHFPPEIPNVLPQLKPSQPHQSINIPKRALVGLLISGSPLPSKRPLRGFSIRVATRPVVPPTRWTAPLSKLWHALLERGFLYPLRCPISLLFLTEGKCFIWKLLSFWEVLLLHLTRKDCVYLNCCWVASRVFPIIMNCVL